MIVAIFYLVLIYVWYKIIRTDILKHKINITLINIRYDKTSSYQYRLKRLRVLSAMNWALIKGNIALASNINRKFL
jgi:hypothetical protein